MMLKMRGPWKSRSRGGCSALGLIGMSLACSNGAPEDIHALPPAGLAGANLKVEGATEIHSPAHSVDVPAEEKAAKRSPDAVVLRVNDVKLTQADYERAMLHHAAALGIPFRGLPEKFRVRLEAPAYEGLLKRELLRQAAQKDGIVVSRDEIEAEKARLARSLPPGRTFADLLQGMMTTEEKFLRDLSTDMAIGQWMKLRTEEQPVIDEQTAQRLYQEQKERFAANEKASARHILVDVSADASMQTIEAARDRAIALRARVNGKDENTFIDVANGESDDVKTRGNGGDLGTFTRSEVLPQIGDAAFNLAQGEISEIVRSDRGFHIFRGGGVTRGAPLPFEDVKERILLIAQTEARAKHEESLFQELERSAEIHRYIDPPRFDTGPKAPAKESIPQMAGQGIPHGLPLPSKDNVLPGMRNPHAVPGSDLRLTPNGAPGELRVSPADLKR